jgi:universal stress protein A
MTMQNPQNAVILVPVDFDEASRRAVSLALEFARALDRSVVLLHVVPPTNLPEGSRLLPADTSDPVDVGEYVSARGRQLLDEHFVSVLMSGAEVRKEARCGHVVETILRAIEECEAKLVVVGTHGRTGGARLLLGSVAEGLVRRSPVPVLVAHAPPTMASVRDGAFARAAAASGAVAGSATGALAGPLGAVAGGAIGTVVGAIAGAVMEAQQARATEHERELDNAIGVTKGSLGAPPYTKKPTEAVLAEAALRSED